MYFRCTAKFKVPKGKIVCNYMKKEQIEDKGGDECPNAFLQFMDKKICNGKIESSRLFCSDDALADAKDIELKYETSPTQNFGFGFFSHVGLCKYPGIKACLPIMQYSTFSYNFRRH